MLMFSKTNWPLTFLEIHEDELRGFFEECGPISSVRIIRNAVTGLGKGFGYVNFQVSCNWRLLMFP